MAGRVIGGFNPLTGQQEDHSADPLGGIEQGLHSGGVQGAVGLMGPHSNSMATKVDSGFSAFERQMLEYVQKIANKEGLN